MPKIFPTDANTGFILCETVRPESGGKLSILGFVAGDELKVVTPPNAPANAVTGIAIGIIFIFRDGEGAFTGKLEIKDPNATLLGGADLNPIKTANEPNICYVNIPLMQITSAGVYSVVLTLDGTHPYTRSFTIKK